MIPDIWAGGLADNDKISQKGRRTALRCCSLPLKYILMKHDRTRAASKEKTIFIGETYIDNFLKNHVRLIRDKRMNKNYCRG